MGKYVKKPVEIEAIQFNGFNIDDVKDFTKDNKNNLSVRYNAVGNLFIVETLEGNMFLYPGNWLIRGVHGELYPCKNDIFVITYDKVGE